MVASEKSIDVTVREVNLFDIFHLFHWANDPETRNNAFSQKPIRFPTHLVWFLRNHFDKRVLMSIATKTEQGNGRAGLFCRFFPRADGKYEITINLAPELRGQRLSRSFLTASISAFSQMRGNQHDLYARVKSTNVASEKLFLSAGFSHTRVDGLVLELILPMKASKN